MSDRPIQHEGGVLKRAWTRFRSPVVQQDIQRPKPEASPQPEVSPNVRHLSKLFYRSFDFSQGSKYLQKHMFEYIHRTHPGLTMSDDELVQVKKKVHESIMERFFLGKTAGTGKMIDQSHSDSVDLKSMKQEIDVNLDIMNQIFNGTYPESFGSDAELLEKITHQIISQDNKFLSRNNGRTRSTHSSGTGNERNNPFMSYLHYYSGELRRIEVPEFTELFQSVRQEFMRKVADKEWNIDQSTHVVSPERSETPLTPSASLSSLVHRWEETHPGQRFMDVFTSEPSLQMAAD